MPEPLFRNLQRELQRGGVGRRYIERTIAELRDHYADLEQSEIGRGLSPQEAAASAAAAIGDEQTLAAAVLSRPELKQWSHRWPRTARLIRSTALVVAMPAVPVLYCAYRRDVIVRWGASIGLASLLTVGLFLAQSLLLMS